MSSVNIPNSSHSDLNTWNHRLTGPKLRTAHLEVQEDAEAQAEDCQGGDDLWHDVVHMRWVEPPQPGTRYSENTCGIMPDGTVVERSMLKAQVSIDMLHDAHLHVLKNSAKVVRNAATPLACNQHLVYCVNPDCIRTSCKLEAIMLAAAVVRTSGASKSMCTRTPDVASAWTLPS